MGNLRRGLKVFSGIALRGVGDEALRRAVEDRVVLVTGASEGIGAATARRLGAAGAVVLLAARTGARLAEVRDGIVATHPLIIDTDIAVLGGEGTIDLKREAIDISLTARPVQTPLPTDLTGISISGTLAEPQLDINPLALAARGVAAATLGVLLKPFTAAADAAAGAKPPCAALLDQDPGASGG